MPSRALQTWQIRLVWRLRSLIFCSSQKPISRKRCVTSAGAESCLMRTSAPVRTLLSGHRKGWEHGSPASSLGCCDSFTLPDYANSPPLARSSFNSSSCRHYFTRADSGVIKRGSKDVKIISRAGLVLTSCLVGNFTGFFMGIDLFFTTRRHRATPYL